MSESIKIRDLLNQLIKDQPNIIELLGTGIEANEVVCERQNIFVRPTTEGNVITVTGIINAISRQYGEELLSVYQEEGGVKQLVGFEVRSKVPSVDTDLFS